METPLWWIDNPKGLVTEEQILSELRDALYGAPDKINFKFKHKSPIVEVYVGESLAYRINKRMYNKLMDEDPDEDNEALRNLQDNCW